MISKTFNTLVIIASLVAIPVGASAEVQLSTADTGLLPSPPTVAEIQQDQAMPVLPLSQMGEQVLESICAGDLDVQQGLATMPDLTQTHIQNACPNRLEVQAARANISPLSQFN